jgi:hypothetical protein
MGRRKKDPSLRVLGENASASWGVPGAHFREADGKFAKDPTKKRKKQFGL